MALPFLESNDGMEKDIFNEVIGQVNRANKADIRTYPVAAGQSIRAGDVVDLGAGGVELKTGVRPPEGWDMIRCGMPDNSTLCDVFEINDTQLCLAHLTGSTVRVSVYDAHDLSRCVKTANAMTGSAQIGNSDGMRGVRLAENRFLLAARMSNGDWQLVMGEWNPAAGTMSFTAQVTASSLYSVSLAPAGAERALLLCTGTRSNRESVLAYIVSLSSGVVSGGTLRISSGLTLDSGRGIRVKAISLGTGTVLALAHYEDNDTSAKRIYQSCTTLDLTGDAPVSKGSNSNTETNIESFNLGLPDLYRRAGGICTLIYPYMANGAGRYVLLRCDETTGYVTVGTKGAFDTGGSVQTLETATQPELNRLTFFVRDPRKLHLYDTTADTPVYRGVAFTSKTTHVGRFIPLSGGRCAFFQNYGINVSGSARYRPMLNLGRLEEERLSGGRVNLSSQGVALAGGGAGDRIPVLLSGLGECPGVVKGERRLSPGVSAYAPEDGVLWAMPEGYTDRVYGGVTVMEDVMTYVELGFTPSLVIIYAEGNNSDYVAGGGYASGTGPALVPRILTRLFTADPGTVGGIVPGGFQFGGHQADVTIYYAAFR